MSKNKLTYLILSIIGLLLIVKGFTIAKSQFETIRIAYGFNLSPSLILVLFKGGLFIEVILILIGLVGLFIKKPIGLIFLLIFPCFTIGYFAIINSHFIAIWGHLLFAAIIIGLLNFSLVKNRFQVNSTGLFIRVISISLFIGFLIPVFIRFVLR